MRTRNNFSIIGPNQPPIGSGTNAGIFSIDDQRYAKQAGTWPNPINALAIFAGGSTGSISNVIDRFTISTLGNATDFGDLTQVCTHAGGCSSATR